MTAVTATAAAPVHRRRARLTAKGFRALLSMQFKLMRREPGAAVMVLLPIAILIVFGCISGTKNPQASLGGRSVLDVYVPTIAAMVPLMVGCTGLPTAMAAFRERNALRRFQVSPVPPVAMLAALVLVMSALAAVGIGVVLLLGFGVFGAKAPTNPGAVVSSFILGFTAVTAVGMIGAAVAPTAGIANGMGLPFMILNFFFSGLYVPVAELPHALQTFGQYVPFGAVMDSWSGNGELWQHLVVLAGYTVVGSLVSAKLFRWE
jgi:ABC-2 type transport system permease protein